MSTNKITFSVERSCGDDRKSIHLYFGDDLRIKVGDSLNDLHALIQRLESMVGEITESHGHELEP